MCQKFDGNDGRSCDNNGNGKIYRGCDGNNNDIDEQILAMSNEQVRGYIFQKFGGVGREVVGTNTHRRNPITRAALRVMFDTMDLNKDGFLQLSEAIAVLRETPELDEDMISSWVSCFREIVDAIGINQQICVSTSSFITNKK